MSLVRVELYIETEGKVSNREVAEGIAYLFENGPFAYPLPDELVTSSAIRCGTGTMCRSFHPYHRKVKKINKIDALSA